MTDRDPILTPWEDLTAEERLYVERYNRPYIRNYADGMTKDTLTGIHSPPASHNKDEDRNLMYQPAYRGQE